MSEIVKKDFEDDVKELLKNLKSIFFETSAKGVSLK
jgi:hypothetical protein